MLPALKRELLVDAAVDLSAVEVDVPLLLAWYRADALEAGATVLTGARVTAASRVGEVWRLTAGAETVEAPVVVNASGAWVDAVAALFGARPRGLTPKRRTVAVAPASRPVDPTWPMASDVADRFYFRPRGEAILASALEDVSSEPEDAQPFDDDVATVIERVERRDRPRARHTDHHVDRAAHPLPRHLAGGRVRRRRRPGSTGWPGRAGTASRRRRRWPGYAAAELLRTEHGLHGLEQVPAQLSPARF